MCPLFFFFNDTATTEIYTLSLHDALPIYAARSPERLPDLAPRRIGGRAHLSRDAVPEGRAALRPGSARRADGHRPRRGVAEADVRRPAPRARAADHSPRPEARERDAGPPSPPR